MTENDKTLNYLQITEGCILIMMNVKAKPINTETQEVISNTNSNPVTSNQNQLVQPSKEVDYSKEVNTLTQEMGFPKEESTAAIKAARGNVTKAIDYLYNGIPDQVDLQPQ